MTVRNPIGLVGKAADGVTAVPLTTTSDARQSLAALLHRGAANKPRAGILPGNAASEFVVAAAAGYTYTVGVGSLDLSPDAAAGAYLTSNDGTVTLNTNISPGSGLSRIDIIYLQVADAWDRSQAASASGIYLAIGAAASSPVAPTIPDNAIELARNTMTSAASGTTGTGNTLVANATPFAALAGGVAHFRTETDLTAGSADALGQIHYTRATRKLSYYDGLREQLMGGPVAVASASERNSRFPAPGTTADQLALQNLRPLVYRTDFGITETYLAAYNATTNPQGSAYGAGWYPTKDSVIKARAIRNAASTIPSATTRTAVTLTDLVSGFQRGGAWSISAGGLVVPYSGEYEVRMRATWTQNSNGQRGLGVLTNGTTEPLGPLVITTSGTPSTNTYMEYWETLVLAAGDRVQMTAMQNTGSDLALVTPAADVTLYWKNSA